LKRKKKNSSIRIFTIFLIVLITGVLILVMPTNMSNKSVFININKGESITSIATKLKENGIIRYKDVFKYAVRFGGYDSKIKSGTHKFSNGQNLIAVIKEITKSPYVENIKVTIPEGYTIAQIQDKLDTLKDKSSLLNKGFSNITLNVSVKSFPHLYCNSLEGYLFPDTYVVFSDSNSLDLIKLMLENFNRRVTDKYYNDILATGERYFNAGDYDEALYEVLTVASLIEREVKVPSERKTVASVIYNRLQKNMPLQIDATVSYVPGKSTNNKSKTLYRDLKKKSPYNTYKIRGLPKGPICNPGIESIKAAIFPENTDYLYYVAQRDGSHVFASTFEEHKKNIKRVSK